MSNNKKDINESDSKLLEIIDDHENQKIEFKESFRWNNYTNQIDRNITKKITSAICGFLASKEGGKILIGVSDNKEIIGIEPDIKSYDKVNPVKGKDKLLTDIGEKIRNNIGIKVINYCLIHFRNVSGKEILLIDVKPYEGPVVHLKKELYVRKTNTTMKLTGREAYNYLRTNYDYKKFRLDLEYAFFNAMRYFRLAKNIIFKKREKYYSLIMITLAFNLLWYTYLFYDYLDSQYIFPFTILTIFLLSFNFNIDLLYDYKNSSKTRKNSYIPEPSKRFVMTSILILIVISVLLSFLLYNVVILMINELKFFIIYSILFVAIIIIYLLLHRTFKREFIFMDNLYRHLRSSDEFEI